MYYSDLAPCDYFRWHEALAGVRLLAIGWLEPGHSFQCGKPDLELAETLARLFRAHGRGFLAGGHHCGFCFEAAGGLPAMPKSLDGIAVGYRDLFLRFPDQEALFAVPELISHYITAHRYQPPAALREAVAWRPPVEM